MPLRLPLYLLRELRLKECVGKAGPADCSNKALLFESRVGSVFLSIFEDGTNPLHERNMGMIYALGPKGHGGGGPKGRLNEPTFDEKAFIKTIVDIGSSTVAIINSYNNSCPAETPKIEEVRWCLLSGGSYRHPKVSKVEVATAIIEGISLPFAGEKLSATFEYDDDAFKTAGQKYEKDRSTNTTNKGNLPTTEDQSAFLSEINNMLTLTDTSQANDETEGLLQLIDIELDVTKKYKPLSVATDCSGYETVLEALRCLKRPIDYLSSSDNWSVAKKSIQANHNPKTFYDDLTYRDNTVLESPDLYVAGFPCQPFSQAGLGKGFDDKENGTIFFISRTT